MFSHDIGFIFAFVSGLFSFFTPCILPIVPAFLIFIGGVSFDEFAQGHIEKKAFILHTLSFILGFSSVLFLLGYSASLVGKAIVSYSPYIVRFSGVILILLGLFYLFPRFLPILNREKVVMIKKRPETCLGSFVVGVTFFLGWTPCLSPALSSILILASMGSTLKGVSLLSFYALGLAIPFFISALLINSIFHALRKFSRLSLFFQGILGIILLIMGMFLLFKGSVPVIPL